MTTVEVNRDSAHIGDVPKKAPTKAPFRLAFLSPFQFPITTEHSASRVWINVKVLQSLFGETDVTPLYAQVAGNVYEVAHHSFIPEGLIGLDEIQYENCQKTLKLSSSNLLAITPFDPHGPTRIQAIDFEITPFNHKTTEEKIVLHVTELRKIIKKALKNAILHKDQSLLLSLSKGLFRLRVKEMNVIKGNDCDRTWKPADTFGTFNEDGKISFSVNESTNIALIDSVFKHDEVENLTFSFRLIDNEEPVASRDFPQKWNSLIHQPVVIGMDLFGQFKKQIHGKRIVVGQKFQLSWRNHSLEAMFTSAQIKHEVSHDFPTYEKAFVMHPTTHQVYEENESIAFIDFEKEASIPREMRFEIIDYAFMDRRSWINIEEFKTHLLETKPYEKEGFVYKGTFVVKLPQGVCLVKLEEVKAHPVSTQAILDLKTLLNPVTAKLVIKPTSGLNLSLVKQKEEEALPITELTFKVIIPSKPKEKNARKDLLNMLGVEAPEDSEPKEPTKFIKEADLSTLISSALPKTFTKNLRLKLETEIGPVTIAIEKFNAGSEEKEPLLGKVTDQTKISYVSEDPEKLEIKTKSVPLFETENIDQLLARCGLAGLSKEFSTIIRRLLRSRGSMKAEMLRRGQDPVKGLILHGPPGTGKTTIGLNIGKLLGCKEEKIKTYSGPQFLDKWFGGTEENIRNMFKAIKEEAEQFGEDSDTHLILIDEIDGLLGGHDYDRNKSSVVKQFLTEVDGVRRYKNFIIIGTTNHLDYLPAAVTRPGRFDIILKIGYPTAEGRAQIFKVHTKQLREEKLLADDVDFDQLVEMTENWTGADIKGLIDAANSYSIDRLSSLNLSENQIKTHPVGLVTMTDFKEAHTEQMLAKLSLQNNFEK